MNNHICNFIIENTVTVPHSELQILETTSINGSRTPKVAFKARLQTAEEKNQNSRYYTTEICTEIVSSLKQKAKSRSLFQEVDHPLVDPTTDIGIRRAVVVELKNCGSLIRDISFKDGHVIAEIETLSSFMGPDLASLILNDKADIGFSLR